jgi:hypothetical protein
MTFGKEMKIMSPDPQESILLAKALYEIRVLLSPYLGSDCEADLPVREAAHLAYALHNEALAVIESRDFDLQDATAKVAAIKNLLPGSDVSSKILCV